MPMQVSGSLRGATLRVRQQFVRRQVDWLQRAQWGTEARTALRVADTGVVIMWRPARSRSPAVSQGRCRWELPAQRRSLNYRPELYSRMRTCRASRVGPPR